MGNKVWILYTFVSNAAGDYEYQSVVGVYTTKDRAIETGEIVMEKGSFITDWKVVGCELDEENYP